MRILIYTDIPLCLTKSAGNVNALLSLLEYFSSFSKVDVLSTHHSRPNRRLPPNVKVIWRPDLINLASRKVRRIFGSELSLFQYKSSVFKKWLVRQCLLRTPYDLIVIEYVENAFLLGEIRRNTNAPVICDMHDLMSQRAKAFAPTGQPHKENLTVGPAEENNALAAFDAVIALQATEAAMVRTALPNLTVVVTRRPPPTSTLNISQERKNKKTVVGFLGTDASFNVDAAKRLTSEEYLIFDDVEYLIGGRVGRCIDTARTTNIRLIGEIDLLSSFYAEIDVLANLIGYGSGLKTKNLEALAHGVPVITTSVGAEGIEDLIGAGVYLANSADDFRDAIRLIRQEMAVNGYKARVRAVYDEYFSVNKVFAELDKLLNSLIGKEASRSKEIEGSA